MGKWLIAVMMGLMGCASAPPIPDFCDATFIVNSGAIQYFAPETTRCAVFKFQDISDFQMHDPAGNFLALTTGDNEGKFVTSVGHGGVKWNDKTIYVTGEWLHGFPDFEVEFHGKTETWVTFDVNGRTTPVYTSITGIMRGHVDFEWEVK